ncbi:amidase [Oryctes borbonicus]|uniref:Amidase n=1 Tax=Oryctes borbonicus TaxID=1629725 RepID=A0A0T6ATG1_9SCAR|nr:amidase [Oryctes borbonicus]
MFNGIFGHKPTPRVTSINGHYPICKDTKFADFLVIGPMTRYAEDLKLMMNIMANEPNTLNLDEKVEINNLKIFWMDDAEKSIVLNGVDEDIKTALNKSLAHLKGCGCSIEDYKFNMKNTCEMSATLLYNMEDIPNVLRDPSSGKDVKNLNIEMLKALFGTSEFTLHALYFYFLQKHKIFVSKSKCDHYQEKARLLKNDFAVNIRYLSLRANMITIKRKPDYSRTTLQKNLEKTGCFYIQLFHSQVWNMIKLYY